MQAVRFTDRLLIAPQIAPEDITALAAQGVRAIINNRPDNEEPGQLSAAEAARLAAAAGIAYHHLPTTGPGMDLATAERFAALVDGADGAVLAHCRSGTRSATLWAVAEVASGRLDAETALAEGRARGFDLSGMVGVLARAGR